MRRHYVQGGKVVPTPAATHGGVSFSGLSDAAYVAQKAEYGERIGSFLRYGPLLSVTVRYWPLSYGR